MGRWWTGGIVTAAIAAVSACGGAGDAAAPVIPEQIGVVREFQGEFTAGSRTQALRTWLLDEADGGRRARILREGAEDFPDTSSRLAPSGAEQLLSTQTRIVSVSSTPAGAILAPPPVPVPLSTARTSFSLDFYRELVRIGEALEVEGSATGGCTDYTAPLVTHALGVLDTVTAREMAAVTTLDGSASAVTIRLCGPRYELSRVTAPPYRLATSDGVVTTSPAIEYRLTPVRRRTATEQLVADTFDLSRVYPGARVIADAVTGSVSP